MNRLRDPLRRHALLGYLALAYAISWGGVLAIVGTGGLRSGNLAMPRGLFVWCAMLAGPSVAGLFFTHVVSGRAGLRDLRRRLARWRVDPRWYATLLIAPAIGSVAVAGLSVASPDFAPWLVVEPNKALVAGVFVALVLGAAIEELGWTGFATPRMSATFGWVGGAVLLGTAHGAWHFLADFAGRSGAAPLLYFPRFVVFWLGGVTALRLLISWVYERTESLLLGQLLHGSYTAPLFLLTPVAASAAQLLVLWTLFTAGFVVVVAALVRPAVRGKAPPRRKSRRSVRATAAQRSVRLPGDETIKSSHRPRTP